MRFPLLPATTVGAAVTAQVSATKNIGDAQYLTAIAKFLYGAGGTTAKVWVQTSIDGGVTWHDIMSFAFTTSVGTKISAVVGATALGAAITPTDATLADNNILSGLLGDRVRVKYTTTGTYTGATSLAVDIVAK